MLIAWVNLADSATVSASSEQAAAPGGNVQIAHLSRKWSAIEGVNSASLIFDMGGSVACGILAVLGSNLTATATLRLRASDADPTGAAGDKYDSTLMSAGAKAGYGAAYLWFAAATARYWRLGLADASITTLEVGRVFIGPKWKPDANNSYGWQVTPLDDSKITESYGRQTFADVLPQRRLLEFSLDWSSEADMYDNAFAMARSAGVVSDVLAVHDTAGAGYLSEQSVWGLCTAAQPLVNANLGIYRQKFSIKERL
jgi:hypothetical protein